MDSAVFMAGLFAGVVVGGVAGYALAYAPDADAMSAFAAGEGPMPAKAAAQPLLTKCVAYALAAGIIFGVVYVFAKLIGGVAT